MALHDLSGKLSGKSLARMWGLPAGWPVTLSWTVNVTKIDDAGPMIEEGTKRGYRHFNIKVAPDPDFDVTLAREVRRLAPDTFLWADANGGYDPDTALRAAEVFQGANVKLVAIPHQYGWKKPGEWLITPEVKKELEEKGVTVATSTMVLSMPGRSFRPQAVWNPPAGEPFYGSPFPLDVVADTLRLFSQGMKVCVEIVVMAADMGLTPVDKEVIAIGGTGRGADTAVVIKPTHLATLLELRVRGILAMPL